MKTYIPRALDSAFIDILCDFYVEVFLASGPICDHERAVYNVIIHAHVARGGKVDRVSTNIGYELESLGRIRIQANAVIRRINKLLRRLKLSPKQYCQLSSAFSRVAKDTKQAWDENGYDPE